MARPKIVKAATLQVLFEPWPDAAQADREGYEVFAGQYLIDALCSCGELKVRGFRAVVAGCTTCRRDEKDPKVHVPNLNDLKKDGPRRRCPQWKKIEALVKSFGGWKLVHYVELAENEGLGYQPIPQRRREVVKCDACGGSGFGPMRYDEKNKPHFTDCAAGCGTYTYGGRGEVQRVYEGPVRPDRLGMSAAQLRKR